MSKRITRQDRGQEVRIDQAHALGDSGPLDAPARSSEGAAESVLQLTQMRTQASQLAQHLSGHREELDRRESELNARLADADREMRAARLWLRERQGELDTQAEAIDSREQQVAEAEAQIGRAVSEADLASAADVELGEKIKQAMQQLRDERRSQEDQLRRQRQQIDVRRRASLTLVQQLLDGVERRRVAVEQEYERRQRQLRQVKQKAFQEDYKKAADEFKARQQFLDDAEALLINGQADLEVQQQQLRMERQRNEEQLREVRSQLAQQQREMEAQWQDRQEALARRNEQLESRQEALEQTRQEVAAMHREALELRLATEELWAKLSQVAPAPALTSHLGQLRRRLAESYCLERNAAVQEKQQLEATHTRLSEQYVKMNAEKKELHDWIARRQEDIEQQAARLVARERQLDRQDSENREATQEWDKERRQYQSKIRKLVKELRRAENADALETSLTA